jgi:tripartite-type tricarboxylate transporter receptor subunit TctC
MAHVCAPARRAIAVLLCALPALALAQQYPNKPIKMLTGSAPGGGADLTGRVIADRLGAALKTQVIVDDKPGATGMIANRLAAQSAPDGYTVLIQPSSFVAISPILNAKDGWDPRHKLAPIVQVSSYPLVMVVHPSVPAHNVKEFIALARKRPGVLNFVSSGVGSNFHLAGEIFRIDTGINVVHVPYRGSSTAVVDLLAGRGDFMFGLIPVLHPYIEQGKLRALAVTGKTRNVLLPNVPTADESGVPGLEVLSWEGVFAPAGTPQAIVERLNTEIAQVVNSPQVKKIWRDKGVDTVTGTPDELAKKVNFVYTRMSALIAKLGIARGK